MSERALLNLVEEVYDAAAGAASWSQICSGASQLVGARTASLMIGDFASGRVEVFLHGEIPTEAVAAYRDRYRAMDLWTQRAAAAAASTASGPVRASISGRLVPDAEFVRSPFYNEFGRSIGLRHVVGAVVPLGEAGMAPIGFHRPDGADPFELAQARLLDGLLPHLRRAIQLRHRLRAIDAAEAPSLSALDALAAGVLVLDPVLRVHLANAAAEAMARGGLVRLRRAVETGARRVTVLEAAHREDHDRLVRLVRETAAGLSAGGAVPLRGPGGRVVATALVSPLPARLAQARGAIAGRVADCALVLIRAIGPSASPPDLDLLRGLYGLTQAEAEVAQALAGGATTAHVAAQRRASHPTVRSQVRAILGKTGARSLRDLERLLTRLDRC